MPVSNIDYLERLLSDVDSIQGGRPGSISGDRWLVANYSPERMKLVSPYLKHSDPSVRADVVTFFSIVRERGVEDEILGMRYSSGDKVGMACTGYLTAVKDEDESIPVLLDIMDHSNGAEFARAARRLAVIARAEDLQHVRKIYGQVQGEMRLQTKEVLERIVQRNPELKSKRDLILSVPVYPDESAFERFLDNSIEYLDVRYRENVHPRGKIKASTYNNVSAAIRKMRTRLYNESDNLRFYGPDKEDRYDELAGLMGWAVEDLSRKEVILADEPVKSCKCPKCGEPMRLINEAWTCVDCGITN